jgi:hypothetical protein
VLWPLLKLHLVASDSLVHDQHAVLLVKLLLPSLMQRHHCGCTQSQRLWQKPGSGKEFLSGRLPAAVLLQ